MKRCLLTGVTKAYGDEGQQRALVDLTLEVNAGELMVLVGPSGCGKSTTLRCIAGLEEPDSGKICVGDRDVTRLSPKERDVAMVFQNYALYPHLRVRDNLEFGLRQRRVPRPEIEQRVREAASILKIEGLLDRWPNQLSGGQQQRVAVGRAMVRRAGVFLLDEPLSNLDAHIRQEMRAEIKALQRKLGMTTIFVTHDQEEAMSLGDRVAVLRAGRLEQVGEPLALYRRPRNVFVARFIGSPPMNILRAEVGGGRVRLGPHSLELDAAASARLPSAGGVLLGVRPEVVTLHTDGSGVPAEVVVVEHLGPRARLSTVLREHADQPLVLEVPAGSGERVRAGDTVRLGLDRRSLFFFDPTTEERLYPEAA